MRQRRPQRRSTSLRSPPGRRPESTRSRQLHGPRFLSAITRDPDKQGAETIGSTVVAEAALIESPRHSGHIDVIGQRRSGKSRSRFHSHGSTAVVSTLRGARRRARGISICNAILLGPSLTVASMGWLLIVSLAASATITGCAASSGRPPPVPATTPSASQDPTPRVAVISANTASACSTWDILNVVPILYHFGHHRHAKQLPIAPTIPGSGGRHRARTASSS